MPIPTWSVGQVLSASDVNNWFTPNAVVKPSDTVRTSTTTLTADPDLTLAVAANSTYLFHAYIDYEAAGPGTGDLKMAFTVPAGATQRYAPWYANASGLAQQGAVVFVGGPFTAGGNGAAVSLAVMLSGSVVTAGTSGNLTLTWAQNTSSGTATKVHAQSMIWAQKTS